MLFCHFFATFHIVNADLSNCPNRPSSPLSWEFNPALSEFIILKLVFATIKGENQNRNQTQTAFQKKNTE